MREGSLFTKVSTMPFILAVEPFPMKTEKGKRDKKAMPGTYPRLLAATNANDIRTRASMMKLVSSVSWIMGDVIGR